MDQRKYWMVHRPSGRHPAIMHSTRSSAVDEAIRLARQHPGESFTVLGVEQAFCSPAPDLPPIVQMEIIDRE